MTSSIQSSALYVNLCLLSYIEHDFSALKRLWMYAPPGTTIDEVIRNYCTSQCPILNQNDYNLGKSIQSNAFLRINFCHNLAVFLILFRWNDCFIFPYFLKQLMGIISSSIVISNNFATFAFTCKPCPGRGYSDDQCLKVLHFPVKRLYIHSHPAASTTCRTSLQR